jgi:two-component system LytT family response regulator
MIRAVIADYEASARSRLRRQLLSSCLDVQIVGEAEDGLSVVEQIVCFEPAVVFLDIGMPGLNAFEVLRALPAETQRPLVILTTYVDQQAVAELEAEGVAYLLKPMQEERLVAVMNRIRPLLGNPAGQAQEAEGIDRMLRAQVSPLRQIVAKLRNRFVLLAPGSISFFAISDGLVWAYTPAAKCVVNYQLADLEAGLPADRFLRASGSALVNIARITEVKPYGKCTYIITMDDAARTEIPVSECCAKLMRELLPGLSCRNRN